MAAGEVTSSTLAAASAADFALGWSALSEEAASSILRSLTSYELAQSSHTCREICELAEMQWHNFYKRTWSRLFALKHRENASLRPRSSWRAACSARANARRNDLVVRGGKWKLEGTIRDGKGLLLTTAQCEFYDDSLFFRGEAQHVRENAEAELRGSWTGNLAADIVALGNKQHWALGWAEKLHGYPGVYHYPGNLQEVSNLELKLFGAFTWFGRVRGTFQMRLFHVEEDDGLLHGQLAAT
eukprot:TRINITY_DN41597_c0_g1_i1.p1 TRINITY_DN41597_c0_g1~~TRINITY_DN41597_c0_g1_i1.p1  ORF type:complete len:242 (-),score=53.49 TRINITY_DN41597_c0_g1_i1:1054-1779(-)